MNKKSLLQTLAATLLLTLSAQASLVVYEPFSYTAGTSTSLVAPAAGATSSLVATSATGLTGDWNLVNSNNAPNPHLSTITAAIGSGPKGNRVGFTLDDIGAGLSDGQRNNFRLNTSLTPAATAALTPNVGESMTMWFSVMGESRANFQFQITSAAGVTVHVGYNSGSSGLYITDANGGFPSLATTTLTDPSRPTAGAPNPFYLVGSLTYTQTSSGVYSAAADTMNLWMVMADADLNSIVDESSLGSLAIGHLVNSGGAVFTAGNRAPTGISLRPALNGSTAPNPSLYDEIRIGTDLASVIPEPSHYAAAFAAIMGLLVWFRRRK